ncbi:hypothetical protein L195_g035904 [Trifolium pratense]|uniref:Uncharacterized protein n=1 Tax=Trifolium pratense TaxID=57577 RepID=A0A2K3LN17_TRIPR|nr:hypothetical protein L195_g035904 [Trifolium pratense]
MILPIDNNLCFLNADLCLDTPPLSSEYAEVSWLDVVEVIGLVKEIFRRQLLCHRSTAGGGLVDSRLVVAWWTIA